MSGNWLCITVAQESSVQLAKIKANQAVQIKPYMTNKKNITLKHDGKIMNNPNDFCDIFNGYFTNAAHEIGREEILNDDEELDDTYEIYGNLDSIVRIQEHVNIDSPFHSTNVSVGEVQALLQDIIFNKTTGCGTILPLVNHFFSGWICHCRCRVIYHQAFLPVWCIQYIHTHTHTHIYIYIYIYIYM